VRSGDRKIKWSIQNAAVPAGEISLAEIYFDFLPADYWSNRHIALANSVTNAEKSRQCTNLGEIHKFTWFLHLLPQIEQT
jgi:hypothetical protein